ADRRRVLPPLVAQRRAAGCCYAERRGLADDDALPGGLRGDLRGCRRRRARRIRWTRALRAAAAAGHQEQKQQQIQRTRGPVRKHIAGLEEGLGLWLHRVHARSGPHESTLSDQEPPRALQPSLAIDVPAASASPYRAITPSTAARTSAVSVRTAFRATPPPARCVPLGVIARRRIHCRPLQRRPLRVKITRNARSRVEFTQCQRP